MLLMSAGRMASVMLAVLFVGAASPAIASGVVDSVGKLLDSRDMQDPEEIGAAFGVRLVETTSLSEVSNVKQYKLGDPNSSELVAVTTVVDPYTIRPLRSDLWFARATCISLRALEQRFSVVAKPYEIWANHQPVKFHAGFILAVKNSQGADFDILASVPKDGDCASSLKLLGGSRK